MIGPRSEGPRHPAHESELLRLLGFCIAVDDDRVDGSLDCQRGTR